LPRVDGHVGGGDLCGWETACTIVECARIDRIPLPRDDMHGGDPLPPPSSVRARAVPVVLCTYPPLLLMVHFYRDYTPPSPTPTDFSTPNSQAFDSFSGQMGLLIIGASFHARRL